ncbi:hypothetical protein CFC21_038769 [Triticum aestivum]|uniref:Bifunctional inhibitor/plant lipid transfer protein/seed storage helical domain-containing protein n=2 Tax=Triticum aestivum TaxID=4565 RepID=A0A9R1FEX9_WHEAT|nr:hypothetical protein CFC21_038769 [Triticum aestivum]CDM80033.1 unnamed protein product [Triticum aestivum]
MAPKAAQLTLALSLLLLLAQSAQGRRNCPVDVLVLRACLSGPGGTSLLHAGQGGQECCPLLGDLVAFDAALCICTALHGRTIAPDIDQEVPISLILNGCDMSVPTSFQCPQ